VNRTLFITGATGFLGRRLLERVSREDFRTVHCLSRRYMADGESDRASGKERFVPGDLMDPDAYRSVLRDADVVLHLAAVTGKAPREEYYRVNVEGTRRLVDACLAGGVRKFLHVSSIAATFPEDGYYHYGRSKREAESIVAASGLSYAIVRPTIVLGKGSPIWRNLALMGRRSPVFLPGGGTARIQPIHVDDLAASLLDIVRRDWFPGDIVELGGRDRLPIEEMIRKIHRAYRRKDPAILHVPLSLILPPLQIAERIGLANLPVNAGQFASFRYDGVAAEHPIHSEVLVNPKGVDEIIGELAPEENAEGSRSLERECEVFTRYLYGRPPGPYILRKYIEANRSRNLADPPPGDQFGMRLLGIASKSPILTKLADAFAAVFAKRSLLRKKLVLLIAILESSAAAGELFGPSEGNGRVGTWASLLGHGVSFLVFFLLSLLVFVPLAVLSKPGTARTAG